MPTVISLAQGMKSRLVLAMPSIARYQQRLIQKNLLGFHLRDAMLVGTFPAITLIPIETGDLKQNVHVLYISYIYDENQALWTDSTSIREAIAFPTMRPVE